MTLVINAIAHLVIVNKQSLFPGIDFILVNGGQAGGAQLSSSSLIALDATPEQVTSCSPPSDLNTGRKAHMLNISGGRLVVCGGRRQAQGIGTCEIFYRELGMWVNGTVALLSGEIAWFPSVQLDDNRIWMGRKFHDFRLNIFIYSIFKVLNHFVRIFMGFLELLRP